MTYDEIKSCFSDSAKYFYWDVTQAEIKALAVDHWMGQTKGTLYLGTPVEVPELAAKQVTGS